MDLSTTGDVSLVPQIVEQRQAFDAEVGSAAQRRFASHRAVRQEQIHTETHSHGRKT